MQAAAWATLRALQSASPERALPLWAFLPLAGALCGYATNWIALWLIFNPLQPQLYCGVPMHGLFLRRQREVSKEFAVITSARVLTARHLWERLLFGPWRARFERLIATQLKRTIDAEVGCLRPLLPFTLGSEEYLRAKELFAQAFIDEASTEPASPTAPPSSPDGRRSADARRKLRTKATHEDCRASAAPERLARAPLCGQFPEMVPSTYAYTEEAMCIEDVLRTSLERLPFDECAPCFLRLSRKPHAPLRRS